jgi:hypothetical protein
MFDPYRRLQPTYDGTGTPRTHSFSPARGDTVVPEVLVRDRSRRDDDQVAETRALQTLSDLDIHRQAAARA